MSNKASQIQWDRNTSILLKGSPGFGKTIAALSAAVFGEVYLAYIDKNQPTEVMTFFKKYHPELLERIDYDVYGSSNINEYLNKLLGFISDCRYVAVITDGVTFLTSSAMNWSQNFEAVEKNRNRPISNDPGDITPDFDEYKVLTAFITRALDITKVLPVLNVWTAHPLPQLNVQGQGTHIVSVTQTTSLVSAGSKVGAMIPGAFNEIYHISRQMQKRMIWTDMVGDDFARTSLPLPRYFEVGEGELFFQVWEKLVREGFEKGGFKEDSGGSGKWRV